MAILVRSMKRGYVKAARVSLIELATSPRYVDNSSIHSPSKARTTKALAAQATDYLSIHIARLLSYKTDVESSPIHPASSPSPAFPPKTPKPYQEQQQPPAPALAVPQK